MIRTPSHTTEKAHKDLAMAELIRRTQVGDQDAFGELFERNKNLVFRTAYLMLGEIEEADEALQEVFLKVYRSLSSYQPAKSAFTSWLYRITINYCINLRRRKRFSFVPLEWVRKNNGRAGLTQPSYLEEDLALILVLERLSDKLRAQLVGAWGLLGLFFMSALFNTFLGEEFVFRGVLLPKMEAVFGKWDWVANGVLFCLYHLHQPWGILATLPGDLVFAYSAKRFRSNWFPIILHSGQTVFFLFLILGLVLSLA